MEVQSDHRATAVSNHPIRGRFFWAATFALLTACEPEAVVYTQGLTEIAGSWTGGEVLAYAHPDSQVVFFSVRPDSTLCLSMICEVGPRARIWTYDIDVTSRDGRISWAYHEGHLNAARDTMWVSKDYRGDRSEWRWVRDRTADALMNRLATLEEAPFEYRPPETLDDDWSCAEPESADLERAGLTRFLEDVSAGKFGDLHGFLLARHGTLVVEEYFARQGSWHGTYINSLFRERCHHLASITKSIVSTLVGIAVDRGFITGVRDPIVTYLPASASLLSGEKGTITIEHLLTMSSGLEWFQSGPRDPRNDAQQMWQCEDAVEYVLEKPLVTDPGRRFLYSNGSAVVVGAILGNATGRDIGSFAEEYLFRPLGITDYQWTSYPDGTVVTDGGLALRPRDLAKIGQTFLDHGRWQGLPVIPAEWTAESTQKRFTFGSVRGSPLGYGYFWMQMELPAADGTVTGFYHTGDGGQLLMVIPALDMVVVFTGGIYGTALHSTFRDIMSEYILPAIR